MLILAGERVQGIGDIMASMKLVVVRHGETVENVNQIIQGNLDGTLSKLGEKQAEEVAVKLKDEKFDQIWSSDLGRCVHTAKYIMEFHPKQKLQLTPTVREMSFGVIQGQYSKSIDWDSQPGTVLTKKFPEGESALEMSDRVLKFINSLLKKYPDQKILLITHGGPIRAMRSSLEKISLEALYDDGPPNGSIWRYEISAPLKFYDA
jgi:broad specificity phosphatase PhoE